MAAHAGTQVRLASWAASFLLAAACGGGEVVVDFAVDAQVTMRDLNGKAEETGTIVTVPRPGSFDAVQYRSRDFDWTLGVGAQGWGGSITNRSTSTLCLRFDEAKMRSNLHPEAVALTIYHWSAFRDKWDLQGSTDPHQRHYFRPQSFCLEPREEASIGFAPNLELLFPTRKMFNVSWPDKEPNLAQKGAGNWIAMTLPVEIGQNKQLMDVKLTAMDSKARIGNW